VALWRAASRNSCAQHRNAAHGGIDVTETMRLFSRNAHLKRSAGMRGMASKMRRSGINASAALALALWRA